MYYPLQVICGSRARLFVGACLVSFSAKESCTHVPKEYLLLLVWTSTPGGYCHLSSTTVCCSPEWPCPCQIGRKQASSNHINPRSPLNWPVWSWRGEGWDSLEQLFSLYLNHRDSCCSSVCLLSAIFNLSLKTKTKLCPHVAILAMSI